MGSDLRKERLRQQWTIEDVAQQLGVHPADVWALEQGNRSRFPTEQAMRRLGASYERLLQQKRSATPIAESPELLRRRKGRGKGKTTAPARAEGKRRATWTRWVSRVGFSLLGLGLVWGLLTLLHSGSAPEKPAPAPPVAAPPPLQLRLLFTTHNGADIYSVSGTGPLTVRVEAQAPVDVKIHSFPQARPLAAGKTGPGLAPVTATSPQSIFVMVDRSEVVKIVVNNGGAELDGSSQKGRATYLFCREGSCPVPPAEQGVEPHSA